MVLNEAFTPFYGFVEDIFDPEKLGRIRVRVVRYHTQNKGDLPTGMLKWFYPVVNNSAALDGIGTSPTEYLVDSMVFGYFIDADLQDGIVVGGVNSIHKFHDVNRLARNEEIGKTYVPIKNGNRLCKEPLSPYSAEYPYNTVHESESGHVWEIDDTEENERIHIWHRKGSYIEMHPDGNVVYRSSKKKIDIVGDDNEVYIHGNWDVDVNGSCDINIKGDLNVKVGGVCNIESGGNMKLKAPRIDFNPSGTVYQGKDEC